MSKVSKGERNRRRRLFHTMWRLGGFKGWNVASVRVNRKDANHMAKPSQSNKTMLRWNRVVTACGGFASRGGAELSDKGICRECIGKLMAEHFKETTNVDSSRE